MNTQRKSPLPLESIYQIKRDAALMKAAQDILRVYDQFSGKIDEFNAIIAGKFGPKGDKGDKPTPQEVRDHLMQIVPQMLPDITENHLKSLIAPLIPEVSDGEDGEDGDDGYTPQKGVDYMTDDDIAEIASKASELTQIPEIDHTMILGALNKARKPVLKPEHIEGIQQLFSKILDDRGVRGYVHGGGDTVKAGTGVAVTRNSDGTTTIAATGSSGTVVNEEVVSFSGTSGTLAHTPITGTLKLFRGGARLQSGTGNDYTLSGADITLASVASAGEIFLADYQY